MKKIVTLLLCLALLLSITGCDNSKDLSNQTSDNQIEELISNEEENNSHEQSQNEATTSTTSTTDISTTTKPSSTVSTTNRTTVVTTSKATTTFQTTTTQKACTPKKFNHKYTYIYETQSECEMNGDQPDAFDYFIANGITASMYGCEQIKDECGKIYFGVYFTNTSGEKYYY